MLNLFRTRIAELRARLEASGTNDQPTPPAETEQRGVIPSTDEPLTDREEAARQKEEAQERARLAAIEAATRDTLLKRDHAISTARNACVIKQNSGGYFDWASKGSDHQSLSKLLNVSSPPLDTYQSTIDWLPHSSEQPVIVSALNDRIEYDGKTWGQNISRSGGGAYSWETLKAALLLFSSNCLWRQYDHLATGAAFAISGQAVALGTGEVQAKSNAERVAAKLLSGVPSQEYKH